MSINANELRIGNWVNEEVLGNAKISLISNPTHCCLRIKHMSIDRKISDIDYTINLSNIKPISLTPEILIKCGFEEKRNEKKWKCFEKWVGEDGFKLQFNWRSEAKDWVEFKITGNGGYDDGGEMDISQICNYLHQLQNLYFALTGTELEIKL